jgi:hypothetical protein
MRIFGVAVAVVILALSCHAIDSEESADRDDFYDSRGESDMSPTFFVYFFGNNKLFVFLRLAAILKLLDISCALIWGTFDQSNLKIT